MLKDAHLRRLAVSCSAMALAGLLVSGCQEDATTAPVLEAHSNGIALTSQANSDAARSLADLRRFSASFHDLDEALAAGYTLFVAPPLTAADGCISDPNQGGMGYHYTRGDNLGDDEAHLLDPEFLVYAPMKGVSHHGETRTRLAGFDYFIPYSETWPGPDDGGNPPSTHDFPSMQGLPYIDFAESQFDGWMFHIWLWHHNPDGMFENWNGAVPLCEGSGY